MYLPSSHYQDHPSTHHALQRVQSFGSRFLNSAALKQNSQASRPRLEVSQAAARRLPPRHACLGIIIQSVGSNLATTERSKAKFGPDCLSHFLKLVVVTGDGTKTLRLSHVLAGKQQYALPVGSCGCVKHIFCHHPDSCCMYCRGSCPSRIPLRLESPCGIRLGLVVKSATQVERRQ